MLSKRGISAVQVAVLTALGLQPLAYAASGSEGIEEVVVTAQRREQSMQDVPVAVSVVTGADLQDRDINSLMDVANEMADVKITHGTLTNSMNIRGVGSGNNSGFEQSVATFEDGVYRPRSRSTEAGFLDVDRIEVLKGPQTTFFGANAIAGAVNITTRKPDDTFSYNGDALYSVTDGEYRVEGALTLPTSDTFSVRVAGRASGMDGYVKMLDTGGYGPNTDGFDGRISFRFKPSENYQSDLRIDYGRSQGTNTEPSVLRDCPASAAYGAPGPTNTCGLALFANPQLNSNLNFKSYSPPSWDYFKFIESAFTNVWKVDSGSVTSVTSYFNQTANNLTQLIPVSLTLANPPPVPIPAWSGYDPLPSIVTENFHQFSQELRFQSNTGGRVDYMYGAYFSHSNLDTTSGTGFYFAPFAAILSGPPFNIPTTPTDAITGIPAITVKDTTVSGFGSVTIHATDDLRVNLGARYSRIEKEGERSLTFGYATGNDVTGFVPFPTPAQQLGMCVILTCDNNPFSPGKITNSKFMPSAGLQYDLQKDVMLYATYTNGFKAGGFSGQASANTFGPETVNAYEAGIKGLFLDRTLLFNAAAFRMDYKGLQETAYTQTLASIVLNAASTVSQGLEANVKWRPVESFTLHADMAYLDAKYEDFLNAPCTSAQVLTGTCGSGQDMSGKPRGYSPKYSGNIGFTAQTMLGSNVLRFDPSVYLTTSYFLNSAADPLLHQGGYAKYDARFSYGPEDGHWQAALIGKNLSNKETFGFMLEMPGAPGTVWGSPERGRVVALEFSFRH